MAKPLKLREHVMWKGSLVRNMRSWNLMKISHKKNFIFRNMFINLIFLPFQFIKVVHVQLQSEEELLSGRGTHKETMAEKEKRLLIHQWCLVINTHFLSSLLVFVCLVPYFKVLLSFSWRFVMSSFCFVCF